MVQMLLRVVQKGLGVAEMAAEGGVRGSLVGKAIGVDPPVVLVAGTKQLVVVEVDETRDGVTQNAHQAIAPVALDHLKSELQLSRRDLLPADLAYHTDSQLAGTLLEQAIASHLRTRTSKARGQLDQVSLEDQHVLVGADLSVCSGSIHLHKF
jgi:hypothetical protein